MQEPTTASAPGLRDALVPEGYVEQAAYYQARAREAEAESASLAAQARERQLTIKALARERDEREVEAEILRAHLRLVCEDAAHAVPFASVVRARALLAVARPCAPCTAGVPGSCNDLFGGQA